MNEANKSNCAIGMHPWHSLGSTIAKLRVDVWRPLCKPNMPGASMTMLVEELDSFPNTLHFAAHSGTRLVAAARLTTDYLPASIRARIPGTEDLGNTLLSRLVVHPEYQRRGVAKSLENACIEHCRKLGQRFLWAEASPSTNAPLQRLGFTVLANYSEEQALFVRQEIAIVRFQP